jgi:hypothetical protein
MVVLPENPTPADTLADLAARLRELCVRRPELDARAEPAVLGLYLAHLFVDNMAQGGFERHFYRMQGAFLEETERLLVHAKAELARAYFRAAVERCVQDVDAYQRFLDGDFATASPIQDALRALSVEYGRQGGNPAAELAKYARVAAPQVEVWLELNGG